ncbi:MAG: S8/S53 family peptidase, partial [Candidatus Aminicenantes bacterium]|nr:S8/S53 family peptidase [Candidatus Aminicenantes bacterium]
VSLARLDLHDRGELLDSLSFDTLTEWPAADRLPEGFDPARILENAATPGLGVRGLHEKGIDGKGIGLAIVDQPLLLGHREYSSRLVRYDATGLAGMAPQMHASPVASIAVGQTLGVAPGATLTFFAVPTWQRDNEPYTGSLRAILALNEKLPAAERIRVVSISTGMFPRQPHFEEWKAALEDSEKSGVLVVTCDPNALPYGILSLRVGADPDDPASYGRGRYSGKDDLVLVPGQNRAVASHLGEDVYTFDRTGGMSWGAPYIAGLAALAFQLNPDLSPGEIRQALVDTTRRTEAGPVVDPAAFLERVRARAERQRSCKWSHLPGTQSRPQ